MATADMHAYAALAAREPVFAALINVYGLPRVFVWHDGGRTGTSNFAAMLLHVVGQQISADSAFTIYDRITSLTGRRVPTAKAVAALGAEQLRRCGLSRSRSDYAVSLANAEVSGGLDIEHFATLPDDEVIRRLTAVRGIGLWSAQTFLIHNLCRIDVMPEGDGGIRQAIHDLWRLDALPSAQDVRSRGLDWAPFRSYAAAMLWRSLRPAGELSDPKERALERRKLNAQMGGASQ